MIHVDNVLYVFNSIQVAREDMGLTQKLWMVIERVVCD